MKNILITGANKGIGFEAARQLGKEGHHILLSGRDEEKVNLAVSVLQKEGISVQSLVMDVSDRESIFQAAEKLSKQNIQLDVLVNNAGILFKEDRQLEQNDPLVLEKTFATNTFGPLYCVQAFLPMMKSGSAVVNVSSQGGQILNGISTWSPAYCVSKTSLNAISMQLAHSLSPKGIIVTVMDPGWVKTDMGGTGASRTVEKGAETIVWLALHADQSHQGKFFRDKKEIHW